MRSFRTYRDSVGAPSDIQEVSDSRHTLILAAGVGKNMTVPANATAVLFNATGPFWVQYGGTATLPGADDLSGAAPELAPAARRVVPGQILGFVAPMACVVSISFYEVRE